MLRAVVDDVLGKHRSHTREAVELLHRRRVEAERHPRWTAPGTTARAGTSRRRPGQTDQHLLTVEEDPGPVDPGEISSGLRPTGRPESIRHT
ncbi:hypothetical protein STANM309S_04146 [Streptomyces tanashiensis]